MSRDLKTNIYGVVTVCISRYDITIYVYQRLCKFSNLEISNLVKKNTIKNDKCCYRYKQQIHEKIIRPH